MAKPLEVDIPLPITGGLTKDEDEALKRVTEFLRERDYEVDDAEAMRVCIMIADTCRQRRQSDFWAAVHEWAEGKDV